SGKLLAKSDVGGYTQYGRGTFSWEPSDTEELPAVLFAHDAGIEALDPLSGVVRRHLSDVGAWQLRVSSDGAVLVANLPNLDVQRSELAFYGWAEGALVPALRLRLSERVDGVDLSADKTRLALSFYPSGSVELYDLKERALLVSER